MNTPPETRTAVTCPACGLLCDDLSVAVQDGQLQVTENGCAKSRAFFEQAVVESTPRVNGQPTSLEIAVAKAAELLGQAKHPLIGGLATDIHGMRAVMDLAGTAGATLDHMNGYSSMRNLLVLQNSGWQTTTLTEVRNRVDLLVVIGTDIVGSFPKFFERLIWNKETLFGQETATREVVYLGGRDLNTTPGISPTGRQPEVLPCDLDRLPEVLAALRAIAGGKPLQAEDIAGISAEALAKLAERLKTAKYGVIAWSATALDFPHAELAIQSITGLIGDINKTTRCSGLPLSGNEGDVGAYNTSAWISGYPLRSSYRRDYPDYDPYHYDAKVLLGEGEADALLWINSYSPKRLPPKNAIPNIVIGHPATTFEQEPAVFIPVATPGIEIKGIQFRSDSSVSLPLQQLRQTALPSLATVLAAIESGLQ
jgi:formylmethanofuran dehydrogenase subunit B